jgi:putative SOS response-associated peptidase YedK
MCGRYVSPDEASIEREFNLVHSEWQFPPSFNVAPTQSVPVIRSVDGKPHRMPAILEKADREAWLAGTPEEAWETLTPYPDDLMVAWPVSTRVNAPKNNDTRLVEPLIA